MIDRTSDSKKNTHKGVVPVQNDVQSAPRLLSDKELSFFEEAFALDNPTPEAIEAFHEYLRKNGSGAGDP